MHREHLIFRNILLNLNTVLYFQTIKPNKSENIVQMGISFDKHFRPICTVGIVLEFCGWGILYFDELQEVKFILFMQHRI